MSVENSNNDILMRIYGDVQVVKDNTRRIETKLDEHSREIDKLSKNSESFERRITSLEDYNVQNKDTIDKAKTAISMTDHISANKWKWLVGFFILVMFLSSLFTLAAVDYRAIDIKILRHVSEFLVDPVADSIFGQGFSHSNSSSPL